MTLSDLVQMQREFDRSYFVGATASEAKRRHIVFHLGILLGKLSRAEERADHGEGDFTIVTEEVIPDLLVYAAQLSDIFGITLESAYKRRLSSIRARSEVLSIEDEVFETPLIQPEIRN